MLMRKRLGKLSKWKSPFLEEAIHLSRAIEAVATTFLSGPNESYKWSIPAIYTQYNVAEPTEGKNVKEKVVEEKVVEEKVVEEKVVEGKIYITIYKDESHAWRVDETELEAILSLWLYSTSSIDLPEISRPRNLRAYELDGSEERLTRDLQWWMPENIPQSFKPYSENELTELIEKEPKRITVGYNVEDGAAKKSTATAQPDLMKKYFVFECQDNRQRLFSRELFYSFMRAIAKMPEVDIASASSAHPLSPSTMSGGWEQMKLKNETISDLAKKLEKIGFGSLSDIYIDLIIPLTLEHKLTNVKNIIDDVAREAHEYERTLQWENVVETCNRLLKLALRFDLEKDSSSTRAVAICLGFLYRLHHEAKLQETERRIEDDLITQLESLKEILAGDTFSAYFSTILPDRHQFFAATLSMLAGINSTPISFPNSFQITATNLDIIKARDSKQRLAIRNIEEFEKTDAFGWSLLHYAANLTLDIDNNWQERDETTFPTPRDLMEWTPLHHACVFGNKELVDMLLRYKTPIEIAGKDGITPMHCAVQSGKVEIVQQLIGYKKHRRNIRHVDRNERHPIHWAAVEGNVEMVHLLEDDIDLPDRFGDNELRTPLHLAVEYELTDAVQTLIQVGANVKTSRKDGRTPLHVSLSRGKDGLEVAKLLLHAGADVNTVAKDGATALHIAAQSGSLFDFLNFLLDNNLKTPAIDATDEYGQTALLIAIYEKEWEAVQRLLDMNASVDADQRKGYTPVLGAVLGENQDILQQLLDRRASVDDADGDGYSALHISILNQKQKIFQALLNANANIDALISGRNDTPLHIAVRKGQIDFIQTLLSKGANTTVLNFRGFSPLQQALHSGGVQAVQKLIEHDKTSTTKAALQKNKEGDTPLHTLSARRFRDSTKCKMLDKLMSIGPEIEINAKNIKGLTPLDLALTEAREHRQFIFDLLEKGAEPGSETMRTILEDWKDDRLELEALAE
ncbi:hypothetical protein TGAMA5MH_04428 [Trichoderma gamsii]|uniref:Uncharacterized protein n=1 Tax=Trichoderma gamsii TaxID=398673 RepID=A0A2K0TF39_9HYPO|nr:hypothetical protein TGAMA5MH_04428 [Trichoderma gamsii]